MSRLDAATCGADQMGQASVGAVAGCPPPCAVDFTVDAPCRIIKVAGGQATLTAHDLPGFSGGTFTWSTRSSKIRLLSTTGATITVEARTNFSSSRDAEVVQVVRRANGCPTIKKTVNITVAKVTINADPNQRYGYDNNDSRSNHEDDNVCIKQSDYTTIHLVIQGGALGTDFDYLCDTASLCTTVAPSGSATFDLRLNGGATNKGRALLKVKGKCPAHPVFTQIGVCVYKERVVEVVVAKIDHPTAAHRSLRFPTADYASHAATANNKLKQGIVKYNISNFSASNGITAVTFVSGSGILSYDITSSNGGPDLVAIAAAMTGTGTKVRVAIIRSLKSYYYLNAAVAIGATTIVLRGGAGNNYCKPGEVYTLGVGAHAEQITIVTSTQASNTITCRRLGKAHAAGSTFEFPAGGWGTNPILIQEGTASVTVAKWTVLHEVGHNRDYGLDLSDIEDTTDFMNYMQNWTDYRLRYCPRILHYDKPNTENQWESIPRT